jgi:mRNA-degrading endonuclease RelE of RelBE toxin-antitoxin system
MHRLFYSRRAERQLRRLPGEVRLHVETHLENVTLLLGSLGRVERMISQLERTEDGFVSTVEGFRVSFTLDTALRAVFVDSVISAEQEGREPRAGLDQSFLRAP